MAAKQKLPTKFTIGEIHLGHRYGLTADPNFDLHNMFEVNEDNNLPYISPSQKFLPGDTQGYACVCLRF